MSGREWGNILGLWTKRRNTSGLEDWNNPWQYLRNNCAVMLRLFVLCGLDVSPKIEKLKICPAMIFCILSVWQRQLDDELMATMCDYFRRQKLVAATMN